MSSRGSEVPLSGRGARGGGSASRERGRGNSSSRSRGDRHVTPSVRARGGRPSSSAVVVQLFRFAFRWSLPVKMREVPGAFEAFSEEGKEWVIYLIKEISSNYVFQFKNSCTNNYHFQGCFEEAETRNDANTVVQRIWITGSLRRSSTHAAKKYCMKTDTRVAGPWMDDYGFGLHGEGDANEDLWNVPTTSMAV